MTKKVIASGFYAKHGFVVVPELGELDPNVAVIYPRTFDYVPLESRHLAKKWGRVGEEFWEIVETYFPNSATHFEQVEVSLTRYGTVASGDRLQGGRTKKRVYYLRAEADLAHLSAMIVNNILYLERQRLGITWSKREALMDFVMTRPAMRKLFPHFRPVMSQLSRVSARVRKESEEYVRELGLVTATPAWEAKEGKIWLKGVAIGKEMSKLEKKVMRVLIERQGELTTYDELADVLWGAGEFKTYWAINKQVERLRGKLVKLGIDGARIESVRGQGYLLR